MNNVSVLYIKKSVIALFLMSVVFIVGCGPAYKSYVSMTYHTFPPTTPAAVEIYMTKMPLKEYTELGLVSASLTGNDNALTVDAMKRIAAERGANAIINLTLHDTRLSGVAVRWK